MEVLSGRVRQVMRRLEAIDERDRVDGTPRERRLRAIRPEVGEFLMTLALATKAKTIVEIGTSSGYSTLWLATAAERNGGHVTSFDIDPAKTDMARQTLSEAGLSRIADARNQDGLAGLDSFVDRADFVFLDAEKEDYEKFLDPAVRALRHGGCLVADNLTSHEEDLAGFRDAALAHPKLSGVVVPIGRGELVAVKI